MTWEIKKRKKPDGRRRGPSRLVGEGKEGKAEDREGPNQRVARSPLKAWGLSDIKKSKEKGWLKKSKKTESFTLTRDNEKEKKEEKKNPNHKAEKAGDQEKRMPSCCLGGKKL